MSEQKTIDAIMPSAAPSADEVRRWNALPRAERVTRLAKAIEAGFDGQSSPLDIDDIIAEARRRASPAPRV